WLLPVRPDHVGGRAAAHEAATHRRGHRRLYVREPVPLRHVPADPARDPSCGRRDRGEGRCEVNVSRRGFLQGMLAGGGALTLAVTVGCGGSNAGAHRIQHADATGELLASMYITIKPDGRVGLTVNKAEIGQ